VTVFGRRRDRARNRRDDSAGETAADRDEWIPDDEPGWGDESAEAYEAQTEPGGRRQGPWDISEVAPGDDLVDLGGLLVPVRPGMELRADVADDRVVAVTLLLGSSALRVQPYAAPRTMGIWGEVRIEIAAGITQQGGVVDEVTGPFGPELRAQVPASLPHGQRGFQTARFLGVDGPRWFLRGVITGEGAIDPQQAGPIESLFADLVVVRGGDPMAPRDPIPLRLPPQPGEPPGAAPEPDRPNRGLNPFVRGPEITETR
jgi:hypothetical protein